MDSTLILSTSFEPIRVVSWQKAMQMLFQGKVEVLEHHEREIRTVSVTFKLPSVLRLLKYIPVNKRRNIVRFSRANVFMRDQFTCQYCGRKRSRHELTLDHVTPSVQGGQKTWDNIVTACIQCNQRKGGRTPYEAGMSLIAKPARPSYLPTLTLRISLNAAPETWRMYFTWQIKSPSQQEP